MIGILDKYNIDTTEMQATLASISGQRAALDIALTDKDRDSLKTINANLASLRKQFIQEVKESVRSHYSAARPVAQAGSARTMGTTTSLIQSPSATATV